MAVAADGSRWRQNAVCKARRARPDAKASKNSRREGLLPGGPKTGSKPGLAVKAADRHGPQGANGPVSGGPAETGKARKHARPASAQGRAFLACTDGIPVSARSLPCKRKPGKGKGEGAGSLYFAPLPIA